MAAALAFLATTRPSAAEDKAGAESQINQKQASLIILQGQLSSLLERPADAASTQKIAEVRRQIAALNIELAKLVTPRDFSALRLQQQISQAQLELAQLKSEVGDKHPKVAQQQRVLDTLVDQAKAIVAVSRENANEDGAKRDQENAPEPAKQRDSSTQDELTQTRRELANRDYQLAELGAQLAKLERQNSLPPLPNAEVKVFQLVKSPVNEAARTIESLFGAQTLRVATDDRTNSLIVLGAPDSLAAVEALLGRMDQQDAGSSDVKPPMNPPRSLLLRFSSALAPFFFYV
jgi:hypothetical protein